jgi:gluconolactonase
MTLLRMGKGPNPLSGWQFDPAEAGFVGRDLQRPECILAERDGTLWAADARGGVTRMTPGGGQELILQSEDGHFDLEANPAASLLGGTLPNGLAFVPGGDLVIANFGTDRLERMTRDGRTRVLCDSVDGQPMGKVNFVLCDSRGRIWLTVSTRTNPWNEALRPDLADGYVALMDERGLRIVADGFAFTNEIRFDEREEWLYVAETARRRVTRLRVAADGSLSGRETYGPENLGTGFVDGIAFDAYGNLWATMIFADRLIAITPEGETLVLLDDGGGVGVAELEAAVAGGDAPSFDVLMKTGGTLCPWLASVTFGGPDLDQVYLGGLRATTIPAFASPVAGLPMAHWST